MPETPKGTLRWTAAKGKPRDWRLSWTSQKGKAQQGTPPDHGTLAPDLIDTSDNEIAVDYDYGPTGRPINIRRKGTAWVSQTAATTQPGHRSQGRGPASSPRVGHFHNPYNFIPAVEPSGEHFFRDHKLGHSRPVGHKAWYDKYFTGRLTIEIKVETPLLVPDASRAQKLSNGHVILPLLTENDDRKTPKLPPTSFKGALRAAYEAVTNSRMSIFQSHDTPLGRRMDAGEGLAMVPARIGDDGKLELWMGLSNPVDSADFDRKRPRNGRPPDAMYAAWLPQYDRGGRRSDGPAYSRDAIRYPDGTHPSHGDRVICWLRKAEKVSPTGQQRFAYWRVAFLQKGSDVNALPQETALGNPPTSFGNSHQLIASERPIRAWGYVSITNQNIGNKHDERVFFVPEGQRPYCPGLSEEALRAFMTNWSVLVADYIEKARKIIDSRRRSNVERNAYEGREIGKTALSRHICDPDALKLKNGDLCYARIDAVGQITGLYPVMISRELAQIAPAALLSEELRPATGLENLSPADRVFGWVNQQGSARNSAKKPAYKGQLRIASLRYTGCWDADGKVTQPITVFPQPGLPLAILSTPKPEQARFYVAANKTGQPQADEIDKPKASYDDGVTPGRNSTKGLRGRKVYPHHRELPADYWDGPMALRAAREHPDKAQQLTNCYREYVRVAEDAKSLRDDQNRSIEGWVNPGTRFRAEIDVVNLTKVEIGALLYLLNLPSDCHFRLGGGKPLGFGSAHVSLVDLDLADGAVIREELLTIVRSEANKTRGRLNNIEDCRPFIEDYRSEIGERYGVVGKPPEEIPFIKAFLNAARGFVDGKPVHYPRAANPAWAGASPVPPSPQGKNFEWFVENERAGKYGGGPKQSLDPLWAPTGLTMLNVKEDPRGGRAPPQRRS